MVGGPRAISVAIGTGISLSAYFVPALVHQIDRITVDIAVAVLGQRIDADREVAGRAACPIGIRREESSLGWVVSSRTKLVVTGRYVPSSALVKEVVAAATRGARVSALVVGVAPSIEGR